MKRLTPFLILLTQSKISMLGAAIVTSAIIGDLILIIGELFVFESNPYIGIVVYTVFPALAALGLGLIPVGVFWKARSLGARNLRDIPVALKPRNFKHLAQMVFGLTMANLVVFAVFGYRGFHFMESREFCGQLCHQPMHPEFEVYKRSPHSEISCVECHIGSGMSYFVKSKLDGTRQMMAMITGNYSRPIPTPLHNLRPARDVCEVCHHPESFHGNLIKVIQTFEPDEDNTRAYTILNLRVGGGGGERRTARGIHWHVSDKRHIRYYATDERREDIVRVEQVNEDGSTRVWTRPGAELPPEALNPEEMREMDCVDCHNRPTHVYLPPDKALDDRLADGIIDPSIPWIRSLSEELITRKYESTEEAKKQIAELPTIYRERYPDHWIEQQSKLPAVVTELQDLHELYVHPEMNIQWNTYPSLIGHPTVATSACFRCHDGLLRDESGTTITAECEACHYVLADKERDPMIMRMLEDR